jgi:chaperonin GroEL (HSP60 family)
MTYPTVEQYDRWKQRAEEFDMSVSEFMQAMFEAGLKKFDATVEPDETARELREQRNDLRDELDHARSRIEDLENRLYQGERAAVRDYVEENRGATYDEIIQHVVDTVPERVTKHLDDLEGEDVQVEDDRYYPREDREGRR